MFHLFNSVYLDLNTTSEKLEQQLNRNSLVHEADIWPFLFSQQKQFVLSLGVDDFFKLQTTFWKNILPLATPEILYKLHLVYIEDCKFRTHLPAPVDTAAARAGYMSLKPYSRQEFNTLLEKSSTLDYLKKIPKETLSFEFQLADFFYNEKSILKDVVLDKVRHCTWVNWMAELDILRADIINGIADINRLLPKEMAMDVSDTSYLYAQAIGHPYLCWIADANFSGNNYVYVEKNYDKKIFKFLYECFYNMWQVNGEDMSELIDLIYSHQYETLLYRDVSRSFGSVYSAGRFRNRMNQVLISTIYKYKRENNLEALKPFTLT